MKYASGETPMVGDVVQDSECADSAPSVVIGLGVAEWAGGCGAVFYEGHDPPRRYRWDEPGKLRLITRAKRTEWVPGPPTERGPHWLSFDSGKVEACDVLDPVNYPDVVAHIKLDPPAPYVAPESVTIAGERFELVSVDGAAVRVRRGDGSESSYSARTAVDRGAPGLCGLAALYFATVHGWRYE